MSELDHYQSYVVRIWKEDSRDPWQITLRNVTTGERVAFQNLDSACAYMQANIDAILVPPAAPGTLPES